jgi:L-alanine-DL-glutamate epimerase-like enolase superfamily enzyme
MKLKDLEVFVVGTPPGVFGGRYWIFVRLTTDSGIRGYGECYAASVGPGAMQAVIEDVFARHMAGSDPHDIEVMYRRAYSSGFTQRPDLTVIGAFSALEIACWDIIGKAAGQPVHKLIGGLVHSRLRSYTYLYPRPDQEGASFYADPEASAECAARMVALGFTAIKFDPAGPYTIYGGHQPTMPDLDRSELFCKRLRQAVGDRADLLFGTHGQFTTGGARRMARRLEAYDPLWFEEPVPPDNVAAMAEVARSTCIPIAAGERLTTKAEFAPLLRQGAASILQPALGRVGGILEAKKIAAMAEGYNAQIAPHLYAGPIEWAANIQLAAASPNFLLLETIETGGDFHQKLLTRPIRWDGGYVIPPDGPGLGTELNEDVARAHPWTGSRLHLEMQGHPHLAGTSEKFGGG